MPRVDDPADPERCKGRAPDGQCRNRAEFGADYCTTHNTRSKANVLSIQLYHLTEARTRERLAELNEHDPVHALRDVISLARLLVEKRFNLIKEDTEFLLAFRDLNTLQLTVERLTKTAHKVEESLEALLGKTTVLRFGQHVINIVVDELQGIEQHVDVVQNIADRIVRLISTANNNNERLGIKIPKITARPQGDDTKTFLIQNVEDQVRLAELTKHPQLLSLREDIGLQIVIIERRWNLVKTELDLMASAGSISLALRTLEKQIKSAHRFEQQLGNLLNIQTLQQIGAGISQIIVEELQRANIPNFETVSDNILDRIAGTKFEKPKRLELIAGTVTSE